MSKAIKIGELSSECKKILNDYSKSAFESTDKVIKAVGREGAKKVMGTSPTRTSKYASGWAAKQTKKGSRNVEVTIYNSKKPGLAHLLENGHQLRQGGRAPAITHIAPVEAWANDEVVKRLESELGRL